MCDYSLHHVKTRPAKVGDKLITHRFYSCTGGFCAPDDKNVAVFRICRMTKENRLAWPKL